MLRGIQQGNSNNKTCARKSRKGFISVLYSMVQNKSVPLYPEMSGTHTVNCYQFMSCWMRREHSARWRGWSEVKQGCSMRPFFTA